MTTTLLPSSGISDSATAESDNNPLSRIERQQFLLATRPVRIVQRATKVAAFNGWSIGLFAVVTIPFALFSTTSLVM